MCMLLRCFTVSVNLAHRPLGNFKNFSRSRQFSAIQRLASFSPPPLSLSIELHPRAEAFLFSLDRYGCVSDGLRHCLATLITHSLIAIMPPPSKCYREMYQSTKLLIQTFLQPEVNAHTNVLALTICVSVFTTHALTHSMLGMGIPSALHSRVTFSPSTASTTGFCPPGTV